MLRNVYFGYVLDSCTFPLDRDNAPFVFLREMSDLVPTYWLYQDICVDEVCRPLQDGIFIYRDSIHLSKEGSAYLGGKFNWIARFKEMAR